MQETWVQSLGQEDPLEKGKATHSRILAWRTPWTEEEPCCALCLGANFNFPSFLKQTISNSLVGCWVPQSLKHEVGLVSPFLYFPLPLNSSCFLRLHAYYLQYSMTTDSMLHHCHFSQERVSCPFLHQGLVAALQSDILGTSAVALMWPHLYPWILLTRMGFSASLRHIGHLMPCVWIPCRVPLFTFSPWVPLFSD